MQLPEIDFSSLEFREVGSWPLLLRIAIVIGVCITTLTIVYFLIFSDELDRLDKAKQQLKTKSTEFKEQYTLAVNIDGYKAQIADMQSAYQEYIRQLPSSSNIPELIDSLTKIGEHNGLKINSIKIGDPKLISGFYMSLPLTLSIMGGYHNIGLFVNETSKLARIVTLHDFSIKQNTANKAGILQIDLQAETYWLASSSEIAASQAEDATSKKGRKDTKTPTPAKGVVKTPNPPEKAAETQSNAVIKD